MKRKIYSEIQKWKEQWHGQAALLIDGARRVGKSWIAEEFARNEYRSAIIIDFNNVRPAIIDLFENYLTDLDDFFSRLSILTETVLYPRQSVIVFDEVQMYPRARAALKYLVKDGRYDYIETGSLVSINHNVKDIVIPSEEIRLDMFPMDFEEFMWALDKTMLFDFARRQFEALKPVGTSFHRELMGLLHAYTIVGGMPQAVASYAADRDFRRVDAIKRAIIALYRNDISKYAGRYAPRVTQIFDNIPGALQKHERRFRPSALREGSRTRDYREPMFWLDESRVANFCYAATEISVGLALSRDDAKLKIYMADTGLLLSMAFTEAQLIGEIYEKILRGKLEFNKGMITENLVAQMIRAAGHPLFFYSRSSADDAAERMEIDFLVSSGKLTSRHNICPVEVKSGNRYSITSLEKCRARFASAIDRCYVINTKDVSVADGIVSIPLYMAGLI